MPAEDSTTTDPNAAPLEQNIKNLECDGIPYRVVKEENQIYRHQLGISPSRNAFKRSLAQTVKGPRRKQLQEDELFALNAGENAAIEEVQAEERDIRKVQSAEEFHSKIKTAVNRRQQLAKAMKTHKNLQYAQLLKKIINDTVVNFYKQPVKYNRSELDPNDTGVVRNLVSTSGPMSKKGDRSVGFSGTDDKVEKGGKKPPKIEEKDPAQVFVDLENQHFNEKAEDIRFARDRIMKRIVDKSPDDASQKSKKKKKNNAMGKSLLSATRTMSMNDSGIEGLSQGNITQSGFNDSMPKLNQTQNFQRAKPRDFDVKPKALKEINAQDYDKIDDMGQLQINVELALTKLRAQWKQIDEERLIYLIRKITIQELTLIEERKLVRFTQQEIDRKRKDKLEEEREAKEQAAAMNSSMMNRSGFSPNKSGVGFMDRSQMSSPTKTGSPYKKAYTGAESQTDAQSVMTGATRGYSPMKSDNFMGGAFGGGGGKNILSILEKHGMQGGSSGLTSGNKDFMKLQKAGGSTRGGAMSQTGSRKTGRTGVSKSRKSKNEMEDFESMEIEEIQGRIEQAELTMKAMEKNRAKILKKATTALAKEASKKELAPIEDDLKNLRKLIMFYLDIIDWKTPYYMKLPKDHQFYKHYMQILQQNKVKQFAKNKVQEDRELFAGAAERLMQEQQKANAQQGSPLTKGRKIPYE